MKINFIQKIGETQALFSAPIGNGLGWVTQKDITLNTPYDIEINIKVGLHLERNARKTKQAAPYIKYSNGQNTILGLVEDIDEEDSICFRLANDCMIMIDRDDKRIYTGDYLLLTIDDHDLNITIVGW